MRQQITQPDSFGDSLWLVCPDHPDELPVVWIVKGQSPDHMHGITIPVRRPDLPAVAKALDALARSLPPLAPAPPLPP